jgi:hypothetical protein
MGFWRQKYSILKLKRISLHCESLRISFGGGCVEESSKILFEGAFIISISLHFHVIFFNFSTCYIRSFSKVSRENKSYTKSLEKSQK